jgi:hypothetical protein
MVYFLKHQGTQVVFFEKRENLINALESSLNACAASCEDGYPFNITVGCAKNTEQLLQPDFAG